MLSIAAHVSEWIAGMQARIENGLIDNTQPSTLYVNERGIEQGGF